MLCDIHLWCYNSLKAKSGYTLDRLCIRVFILVCDTSALSTASLILPLGLRQACSLFVRSLKSRFLFFLFVFWVPRCFLLPLYYTALPHTVYWHQAETASCCTRSWCVCWWCVITSPSCWVLIRYSAVMSWSDSSGCDGLIVSSVRLCGILSPKPWMSAATNLPAFPPPALVSDYCHFTDLPSVPLAFWCLNPVIFILWSLRVCLAGWAACKHTHSHIYSLVVRRSYSLIAVSGSTDGCINWS